MGLAEWVRQQPGTNADVAARLGIARDTLQKLMRGQAFPRQSTRVAITRESGGKVTAEDMLTTYNAYHGTVQ